MERTQYIIDTNVVIDYFERRLPSRGMDLVSQIMDTLPLVSVITKIEVLGFKMPPPYNQLFINFMQDATILSLSDEIVEASIDIRKNSKIKLPDAIIAATALVKGLNLLTHDIDDFKNIPNLTLVDPYKL